MQQRQRQRQRQTAAEKKKKKIKSKSLAHTDCARSTSPSLSHTHTNTHTVALWLLFALFGRSLCLTLASLNYSYVIERSSQSKWRACRQLLVIVVVAAHVRFIAAVTVSDLTAISDDCNLPFTYIHKHTDIYTDILSNRHEPAKCLTQIWLKALLDQVRCPINLLGNRKAFGICISISISICPD